MDVIILKHLKHNHPLCGYDVVKYFHRRFHMLPSPGTIYSLLYSLERKNLIRGNTNQRKTLYQITEKGEEYLVGLKATRAHVQTVLASLFSEV